MPDYEDVSKVVDEGEKFLAKAREQGIPSNSPFAAATGLAWGIMKVVYECPHCPGVTRVPVKLNAEGTKYVAERDITVDFQIIACPKCRRIWHKAPELTGDDQED